MRKSLQLFIVAFLALSNGIFIQSQNIDFTIPYNSDISTFEVHVKYDFDNLFIYAGGDSQTSLVFPDSILDFPVVSESVVSGLWLIKSQAFISAVCS